LWLWRVRVPRDVHLDSMAVGGSGRKPTHQPSRIRTDIGGVRGQVDGGRRSPRPEKADLE
jgi:hypothetical protein